MYAQPRLSLLIVVATLATSCVDPTQPPPVPVDDGPILIGYLHHDQSIFTEPYEEAARLAVSEVNARGGIFNRPVELVVYNNQGLPDLSREGFRTLVEDVGVVAVIGPWSAGKAIVVADLARQAQVPLISYWGGLHPDWHTANPSDDRWAWSLASSNVDTLSIVGDQLVHEELGCTSVLFVVSQSLGFEVIGDDLIRADIERAGIRHRGTEVLHTGADGDRFERAMSYQDDPPDCMVLSLDGIDLVSWIPAWIAAGASPDVKLIVDGFFPWNLVTPAWAGVDPGYFTHGLYQVTPLFSDPANLAYVGYDMKWTSTYGSPSSDNWFLDDRSKGFDAAAHLMLAIAAAGSTESFSINQFIPRVAAPTPNAAAARAGALRRAMQSAEQGQPVRYFGVSGDYHLQSDGRAHGYTYFLIHRASIPTDGDTDDWERIGVAGYL